MCYHRRQLLTFGTPSAWSPSQTQESGFFRHRKTPPGHTPVDTGMQEITRFQEAREVYSSSTDIQ